MTPPATAELAPRSRTLPQAVADALREAIYAGRFPPGSRILQANVARELGVSQTSVRDAFALLQSEGLVERGDRRGATVIRITRADIEETVSLRTTLEVMALRQVLRGDTAPLIAELEANLDAMKQCRDGRELALLDIGFHESLVRAAGHKRLHACWRTLLPPLILLMMAHHQQAPRVVATTMQNHRKLLRFIRAGDEKNAVALMEQSSDVYLVQILQTQPTR